MQKALADDRLAPEPFDGSHRLGQAKPCLIDDEIGRLVDRTHIDAENARNPIQGPFEGQAITGGTGKPDHGVPQRLVFHVVCLCIGQSIGQTPLVNNSADTR